MFSVALIGADGAGKSTISRKLAETFPLPVRILYMGVRLDSSNVLLPTSRLIQLVKRTTTGKDSPDSAGIPSRASRRRKFRADLRVLNLFAEEWYRQLLSWYYRRNGQIVIYDRHFIFDFDYDTAAGSTPKTSIIDRIHRWYLHVLYPRPDLVIFLDAPGNVLFARKRELTVDILEARRQAFLREGQKTQNFIRIDATQPVDVVLSRVSEEILDFHRRICPKHLTTHHRESGISA
jgi:thymidylate kinase